MAFPAPNSVFHFGPFVLDVRNRSLVRDGRSLHLTPKSFEVLRILASSSGQLVARDDLIATVWPDVVVEEANLSKAVFNLRQLLGTWTMGVRTSRPCPRPGIASSHGHRGTPGSRTLRLRRQRPLWPLPSCRSRT